MLVIQQCLVVTWCFCKNGFNKAIQRKSQSNRPYIYLGRATFKTRTNFSLLFQMQRSRKSTLKAVLAKLEVVVMIWSSNRWQARVKDAATEFQTTRLNIPAFVQQGAHMINNGVKSRRKLPIARGHLWHVNAWWGSQGSVQRRMINGFTACCYNSLRDHIVYSSLKSERTFGVWVPLDSL